MSTDADQPDVTTPPPKRFRFSLKALLLVMTLLCVWLGVSEFRKRQAAAIIARNNAVLDQLAENLDTPPFETRIRDPLFRAASFMSRSRIDPRIQIRDLTAWSQSGRFTNNTDFGVALDVSQAVADQTGNLENRLLDHYATGLAQLGLRPDGTQFTVRRNHRRRIASWYLPDRDLMAILDVDLDLDDQTAQIIIHYRYRDQIWPK